MVQGDAAVWRELSVLDLEGLRRRGRDIRVGVYESGLENYGTRQTRMLLSELAERLFQLDRKGKRGGPLPYMGEQYGLVEMLGLGDAARRYTQALMPPVAMFRHTALWAGPPGSTTGLHTDPDGLNLLCMIHGTKRVHLFAPRHRRALSPSTRYDDGAELSSVDYWDADGRREHPELAALPVHEVVLGPRDILVIPRRWWHAAENLTTTVALSVRAETPWSAMVNLPGLVLALLHRMGLYARGNCTCHDTGARARGV